MATQKSTVNKNKKVVGIVIALLLAVAIAIICAVGSSANGKPFQKPFSQWFNSWGAGSKTNDNNSVVAITGEGKEIYSGGAYTMPKAMILVAEASENSAATEFTITPKLDNEYINGVFDFECYFPEGSPSWANNKTASDYLSITPVSKSSAKVTLIKAFSAPIEIKVTLVGTQNSETCRVDYLQRASLEGGLVAYRDMDRQGLITFAGIKYGTGTVKGELDFVSASVSLTSDFISAFKSYLKFDISVKSFLLTKSNSQVRYTGTNGAPTIDFENLSYSMFIEGFDSYDSKHKDAIYYAWYIAYQSNKMNVMLDYSFNYSYKNLKLNITNPDADEPCSWISGETYGSAVTPDIDLNGDIVF